MNKFSKIKTRRFRDLLQNGKLQGATSTGKKEKGAFCIHNASSFFAYPPPFCTWYMHGGLLGKRVKKGGREPSVVAANLPRGLFSPNRVFRQGWRYECRRKHKKRSNIPPTCNSVHTLVAFSFLASKQVQITRANLDEDSFLSPLPMLTELRIVKGERERERERLFPPCLFPCVNKGGGEGKPFNSLG